MATELSPPEMTTAYEELFTVTESSPEEAETTETAG